MRMAFGLVGLLLTVALMLYIWSMYTQQVASSAAQVRPVAEQIAGVESGGLSGHVWEHVQLTEYAPGGKLQAITVTRIDAGSSMQAYFGLREGDRIMEVGPMRVRDMDSGLAIAMVQEAYQRQSPLVVVRNGVTITLPQQKQGAMPPVAPAPGPAVAPSPAAAPSPAPAPAAGKTAPAAPRQQPSGNPLQRQLDVIRNYGGAGEGQ